MTLKRGVLFPDNPKKEQIKITEYEIQKSKRTHIIESFHFLYLDKKLRKLWKYSGVLIAIILFFKFFILAINDFKKESEKKQRTQKMKLVQEEINSCYKNLNLLKTHKTSPKMKIKMRNYIHFKIDSLATVRDNLKIQ